MNAFGEYADFYDAFYAEKSYAAEAAFVHKIIGGHIKSNHPKILDFGCGTGRHAREMVRLGYEVSGVDRSEAMIRLARDRSARQAGLEFSVGDIREATLGRKFDAVVSLFHVMSYLPGDEDLSSVFRNAGRHLESGGVFLFDFWYGPAVLDDPPVQRERTVKSGDFSITRTAYPRVRKDANLVEITYKFLVESAGDQGTKTFSETHVMRYLFPKELETLAAATGFRILQTGSWLEECPPRNNNWNAWALAVRT